MRLLADERADRSKQLQILQVLGEVRRPAALPVVLRLACHSPDNALRAAALSALAAYDDPAIAAEVLAAYANMSDDVQAAAQSLLASRRAWAARFLEAIEARTIDPQTVPREVVEKLLLLGDPRLTDRVVAAVRADPAGDARPSCAPRSTAWPPWSAPARASPSRASSSSTGTVRAATPSSARAARSVPT